MNKKEQFTRLTVLLAGLVIYQLGVSILKLSGFGLDPFNILVQGFHSSIKLDYLSFFTHGCVHILLSALFTFMLFLLNRSFVTLGTLLCMFLGGPLIDIFSLVLAPVYEHYANSAYIYIMFIAGFVMLTYGLTMMIHSKAGLAPNEYIVEAFTNPKKKNSYVVRLVVYLAFAFVGFIMGGAIGFSTLLCLAIVTPLVDYFSPNLSQKIESYVKKRIVK